MLPAAALNACNYLETAPDVFQLTSERHVQCYLNKGAQPHEYNISNRSPNFPLRKLRRNDLQRLRPPAASAQHRSTARPRKLQPTSRNKLITP